jgi:hypothetical protein
MRPEVADVSQTERLRSAMTGSAISHGQTVRADIDRVEVSTRAYDKVLVFFCGIHGVRVRETVRAGDGEPLPPHVTITGLSVDREGIYDIKNALISSNGRIEISLDDQSSVVHRPRVLTDIFLGA